jgi:general nucleoside transport system ATP-binding protein
MWGPPFEQLLVRSLDRRQPTRVGDLIAATFAPMSDRPQGATPRRRPHGTQPHGRQPHRGVEVRNITKFFPPDVVALDEVSLRLEPGEIHAVVGENGAGKSTLMKILAGEQRADSGQILIDGEPVRFTSSRDAMAAGIGLVHQEILLIDEFTVWENVVLGVEPVTTGVGGRFGARLDRDAARAAVAATIERAGFDLNPDSLAEDLSVGAKQKAEIAKLLHRSVSVLILDEPTAALTPQEVPELFDELRRLRDQGRTIVFISHRLGEVLEIADRVTVLRDGRLIGTVSAQGTTRAELARLMVERDVVLTSQRTPKAPGEIVLSLDGVTTEGLGPLDLTVRAGEIVGIGGLDGNGQGAMVDAIVGLVTLRAGAIVLEGEIISAQSIIDRRRVLAAVPSDRKTVGGAVTAPIVDTARMTHHRLTDAFNSIGQWWQNRRHAVTFSGTLRDRYGVVMASPEQLLGSLSGGNQQKLILGRELAFGRKLLVLDQPTRGIDVGSIEVLHAEILRQRDQGTAVLLISADLEELFLLSDRIVVLHQGKIAFDQPVENATMGSVGEAMLNGPTSAGEPS